MSKKTPTGGNSRWFPVSTLANVIGITPPAFRASILPLLPPDAVRDGRPMLVHGPAAIAAIIERDGGRAGGSDSPALEQMRAWEAKRRELKYRREAGQTIDLAELERLFAATGEILRRAGETIRQEFGERACKILTDAWGDVDRYIDTHCQREDQYGDRSEVQDGIVEADDDQED